MKFFVFSWRTVSAIVRIRSQSRRISRSLMADRLQQRSSAQTFVFVYCAIVILSVVFYFVLNTCAFKLKLNFFPLSFVGDRDITCNRNYIGRLNSGVVTSYNYPFDYRNQTRCTHTIFLDQRPPNSNRTICFQFQRFEVEATPLCNRDTLQFLWSSNFPNPANSYVNYCGNGTWGYYDETLAISNIFSGELCCRLYTSHVTKMQQTHKSIYLILNLKLIWCLRENVVLFLSGPWTAPRFSFVFMSDDYVSNRGFYATYWISDDNATDVPNVTVRKNLFDPTMGPKCKTDPDMCRNHCFHGYEIDSDGCYTCRCLSAYSGILNYLFFIVVFYY